MLLNQVYWPDRAATAQMAHGLAKSLVKEGFEVVAVAQKSGYEGSAGDLPAREVVDGVEIVRVGRNIFGRRFLLLRGIDILRFWLILGVRALTLPRVDVVVTFTTPPLIGLVGLLMKIFRGSRYVYWCMDLYPDIPITYGLMSPRNPVAWCWEQLNRLSLRHADRVAVLGRCMGEQVVAKGVRSERLFDGGVWADRDEITPVERSRNVFAKRWDIGDRFVVMYSGNYGMGHEMKTMLGAAELMRDQDDIVFLFVGGGTRKEGVENFVREKRLTNAQCHPYQERSELGPLLSLADVHLITQLEALTGMFVPSKTYGVMAASRPTIYVGREDAEAARTLVENECGLVVRQGNSEGLVGAIDGLAKDPERCRMLGINGRRAFEDRFTREKRCRAWVQMLRELDTAGSPLAR